MAKLNLKKQKEFDLRYSSLIGKNIKIISSKISSQIGLSGVLLFETANFLILLVNGLEIKIFKDNVTIEFSDFGKALNMDAHLLLFTITNRIKKIK